MKKAIIEQLKEDATIEQLTEIGKINIDNINEDLDLFIEVLEEEFGIKTEIQNLVGGQYLVAIATLDLEDLYKAWRVETERDIELGLGGSIDCGEPAVREDFSRYANVNVSFEQMLELENNY